MLKVIEEFMIFAMGISPKHYAKLQFDKEVFENGIEIHICPKCFEQTIDPLQCKNCFEAI